MYIVLSLWMLSYFFISTGPIWVQRPRLFDFCWYSLGILSLKLFMTRIWPILTSAYYHIYSTSGICQYYYCRIWSLQNYYASVIRSILHANFCLIYCLYSSKIIFFLIDIQKQGKWLKAKIALSKDKTSTGSNDNIY